MYTDEVANVRNQTPNTEGVACIMISYRMVRGQEWIRCVVSDMTTLSTCESEE